MTQTPIINLGEKYIFGLRVSGSGNDIQIGTGQSRDETNTVDLVNESILDISILKVGVNGLDEGTIAADTHYAVYLIGDSSKYRTSAGVISTNFTQPTLPGGYDVYRRIGAILTNNAAGISNFTQYGSGTDREIFYLDNIIIATNQNSTSFATIDLSAAVPPIECKVNTVITFAPSLAGDLVQIRKYRGLPPVDESPIIFGYGADPQTGNQIVPSALNSGAPTIEYKVDSGFIDVSVSGYVDEL